MQANTISSSHVATSEIRTTTSQEIPSPFKWLRDLNETFAAYFKFKDLTEEQLRDMGITKRQQKEASFRQFAPRHGS